MPQFISKKCIEIIQCVLYNKPNYHTSYTSIQIMISYITMKRRDTSVRSVSEFSGSLILSA
ncbi:hypothetical protein JCM10914A_31310 [Paenibacillus sp. JCM 10914]